MPVIEEKRTAKLPNNIIMENRKKVMISGVSRVDSFDEHTVILLTELGELTIKGTDLHISQLNVDSGELNVTGNIYGLVYTEDHRSGGFLSRLFK